MWKIKIRFYGKGNMKKHDIQFTPTPAVGFATGLYNKRTKYAICFVWLFFQIEIVLRYK